MAGTAAAHMSRAIENDEQTLDKRKLDGWKGFRKSLGLCKVVCTILLNLHLG
jgi:hypothetical protein